jgi:L-threonylcarbamoyladenylate synthase
VSALPCLAVNEACALLRRGLALAFPSPCGYGFAFDPFLPGAQTLLESLKPGRSEPVGLLIPDRRAVDGLVAFVPAVAHRLMALWPAELSLVLPAKGGLPGDLVSSRGGVSMRLPQLGPALDLVRAYGSPLTATSLNFPGQKPASTADDLLAFGDLIAGYLAGQVGVQAPSTLVEILSEEMRLLRPGSVELEWL